MSNPTLNEQIRAVRQAMQAIENSKADEKQRFLTLARLRCVITSLKQLRAVRKTVLPLP